MQIFTMKYLGLDVKNPWTDIAKGRTYTAIVRGEEVLTSACLPLTDRDGDEGNVDFHIPINIVSTASNGWRVGRK
jgi:hypothetical protein